MQRVRIAYKNYRGISSTREILPMKLEYRSTPYHEEPQWLLKAISFRPEDGPAGAIRDFAMKDIHAWEVIAK